MDFCSSLQVGLFANLGNSCPLVHFVVFRVKLVCKKEKTTLVSVLGLADLCCASILSLPFLTSFVTPTLNSQLILNKIYTFLCNLVSSWCQHWLKKWSNISIIILLRVLRIFRPMCPIPSSEWGHPGATRLTVVLALHWWSTRLSSSCSHRWLSCEGKRKCEGIELDYSLWLGGF